MTPFNYGAKGIRDVGTACRSHQSNIMPHSIFSINIAQCVTCLIVVCFVLFYVHIKGWYSGLLLFVETGCSFYHYYINGLEETLSYNRLRQIGLISFKCGSLFGALPADSNQRISFEVPVLYMVYCSVATDVAASINTIWKIGCCNWILI